MTNTEPYAKQPWKRRWPENQQPYFPYLCVWTWVKIPKTQMTLFPSIEAPENPGNYDIMYLGQDYDGTEIAMVMNGPEMGKTFIINFPVDIFDEPKNCTFH